MPINYKEYPENWLTEIRPAVMIRAGEIRNDAGEIVQEARCEECGIENHSITERSGKPVKIVITVAHLDHDKENEKVKLERLRAWCQKCHLNYDRPRHREKFRKNQIKRKGLQDMFENGAETQ